MRDLYQTYEDNCVSSSGFMKVLLVLGFSFVIPKFSTAFSASSPISDNPAATDFDSVANFSIEPFPLFSFEALDGVLAWIDRAFLAAKALNSKVI